MTGYGGLAAGVVLTGVFALVYVWIVWLLDRFEKEPLPIVGLAFGGGLIAAPILTTLIEAVSGVPNSLSPASFQSLPLMQPNLAGAVVEEAAKALVVWLVFRLLPHEFDDALDGIVYGAVVGAGFNLAEGLLYLKDMLAFAQTAEFSLAFLAGLFLSGLTHCVFTAVFGACLGYTREAGWHTPWLAALGWAAAAIYHAGFVGLGYLSANPMGDRAVALIAGGLRWLVEFAGIAALGVLASWAWSRERGVLGAQLAGETEIVTPAELQMLLAGRRLPAQIDAFRHSGMAGWQRLRRLHQSQAELAFAKQRLERGLGSADEVEECRGQIRQLRAGDRG